jgi:hypothetical protein
MTSDRLKHGSPWWFALLYVLIAAGFFYLAFVVLDGVRSREDLSDKQLARDAAATGRARAFVEALGFEAGPAVCRSLVSGSAWCTVRVAKSDKTFSLWCSWRHPTCIESLSSD